jgi:DHA2 family lincomycin resistance protein-like MFS transporter
MVLVANLALSVSLALVFTPVFTTALGGLQPRLYSHGSAAISTVQQLAGAAGTALFVAILTLREVALIDGGTSAPYALTGGARTAFVVGAVVMIGAVLLSTRLRKPASPEGAGGPAFH